MYGPDGAPGAGRRTHFSKNALKIESFPRRDLAFPAHKEQEKLTLVLCALVGVKTQHHRCGAPSLGDYQRLVPATDAFQNCRSIFPQIADRNDLGDSSHGWYLLQCIQEYRRRFP